MDGIPVPISTPGWDNAPYVSAAHFVSRDPDSGVHNIGTYRAMIKARDRVGCNPSIELGQGIYRHWLKYRERGEKMPVALCIGGVPAISYVAAQKLAYDLDEFSVAGGLVKAPIRTTQARTVPVMVPADAEIIVEGFVSTEWLEPEAPFGESHGHVNPKEYNPFMEVTGITRRRDAVLCSIISQVTPSESSVIKKMAYEPIYLEHLRDGIGVKSVVRVMLHEPLTATQKLTVIQMRKPSPAEVWRALMGAVAFRPSMSKIVIAVDEDIDPRQPRRRVLGHGLSLQAPPRRPDHARHGRRPRPAPTMRAAPPKTPACSGTPPSRTSCRPSRCLHGSTWSGAGSSGKSWGCRSSSPSRPGSATRWGTGTRSWSRRPPWQRAGSSGRPAPRSRAQRRRTSEILPNTSFYGEDED